MWPRSCAVCVAAAVVDDLGMDGKADDAIPMPAAPLTPSTTVAIEGCSEPVTVAQLEVRATACYFPRECFPVLCSFTWFQAVLAPHLPLRRGKWSREEEEYADYLITEFQVGCCV